MSFDDLLCETAEVLTVEILGTDGYNVPIRGEASVATTRCRKQQTERQEIIVGRDTVVSDYVVDLPLTATVSAFDQMVIGDQTFEVVGPPALVFAHSLPHHYIARLREVIE